jgi:hypothetical protein
MQFPQASEERRCFGVRAAERSVDAALVVPGEANLSGTRGGKPTHSQSASQSVPLQAVRNLGILNEDISAHFKLLAVARTVPVSGSYPCRPFYTRRAGPDSASEPLKLIALHPAPPKPRK